MVNERPDFKNQVLYRVQFKITNFFQQNFEFGILDARLFHKFPTNKTQDEGYEKKSVIDYMLDSLGGDRIHACALAQPLLIPVRYKMATT